MQLPKKNCLLTTNVYDQTSSVKQLSKTKLYTGPKGDLKKLLKHIINIHWQKQKMRRKSVDLVFCRYRLRDKKEDQKQNKSKKQINKKL